MAGDKTIARAVGAVQMIGGGLEIAFGVGGVLLPEPATTAGGVILITHGADTVVAGFRSMYYGEVAQTGTQTVVEAAASRAGFSPATSQNIGIGADILAGAGQGLATSVSRRLMIANAPTSSSKVAVAYLKMGASAPLGHNMVGVTQGGETAWFHLLGKSQSQFVAANAPDSRYVITELAVTQPQAAAAHSTAQSLGAAGKVTWGVAGPNCTTTAKQVLRSAGVLVPEWSLTPLLLSAGAKRAGEVTVIGATAGAVAPVVGKNESSE